MTLISQTQKANQQVNMLTRTAEIFRFKTVVFVLLFKKMLENNQEARGPVQETSGVNTEELQVSQNPKEWTKKKKPKHKIKNVFSNVQISSLSAGRKKKSKYIKSTNF